MECNKNFKKDREGQVRINDKGESAVCIEYINSRKVILKFENPEEFKTTSWYYFNDGRFHRDSDCHQYICGIYKITNKLKNISYIGQSVDIYTRWEAHKKEAYRKESQLYNNYLYRAIRKYGVKNFIFEIVEECSSELLNEREIYWIEYFDTYRNGYNNTIGGEHGKKVDRDKLIEYYNNVTHSIEDICNHFYIKKATVLKILRENNILIDRYVSESEEQKICDYYIKNYCPSLNEMHNVFNRSKDLISSILKKHNIEIINGCPDKILVYNSSGEFLYVTSYKLFNKMLKDIGIIKNKSGSISDVLYGRRKQAYGFIIRYYKENYPLKLKVDENWEDDYWDKEAV